MTPRPAKQRIKFYYDGKSRSENKTFLFEIKQILNKKTTKLKKKR